MKAEERDIDQLPYMVKEWIEKETEGRMSVTIYTRLDIKYFFIIISFSFVAGYVLRAFLGR